jgi:arylsulfatase A-like enzyme
MRHLWLLILFLGCGDASEAPQIQPAPTVQPAMNLGSPGRTVIRLLDVVDNAKLTLSTGQASAASSSRQWRLDEWKQIRSTPVAVWAQSSPVRMNQGIYPQQPSDLEVILDSKKVRYQKGIAAGRPVKEVKQREGRWEYHRNRIVLVTDRDPNKEGIVLVSNGASGADTRLDFGLAALGASEFVLAPVENGLQTRMSLLLPAPARAQFQIQVPAMSTLRFGYGLSLSAEAGQTGEAQFQVHINEQSVWSDTATQHSGWQDVSIDLGEYAGKTVQLDFHTTISESGQYAYSAFSSPEIVGPQTENGPRRIIVVGMDTLRADHLGTHGYERPTSPGLDQIAAQSVVFEKAWTPAPRTRPSFRSATTGRWPLKAIDAPTIGKVMQANGFSTGGFVANVQLAPRLGFAAGFDHWSYDNMADGDVQVDRTLAWLTERQHEDAFVFLHLMDPHVFYAAPQPFTDKFTHSSDQRGLKEKFNRWEILRQRREGHLHPDQERWMVGRYDGEVAFMDHQLTRLLQAVDALPGRTMWVFHTDHGEEFFEHGSYEHNHSLYNELMRAVLWIRPPGGWGGGPHRVEHPVSLVDIAPTVFAAAGIQAEQQPLLDGTDLTPFVFSDRANQKDAIATQLKDRPLPIGHMMYNPEQWGVIYRNQKYIIETKTGNQQWYDLSNDPDENINKASIDPPAEMVDALARAHHWPVLYGWRLGFSSLPKTTTLKFSTPIGEALVIDPEALRKRRANLEWGEVPPVSKTDVATLLVSEDRTELTITPGKAATGILFIEGLSDTDQATATCTLGTSTLQPNGNASICSRSATIQIGPYLAQTESDVQREAPEAATIEALKSLGYLE